jgi:prolyl oligopeptidase
MKAMLLLAASILAMSAAAAGSQPPAPPAKPVTETLFGQTVTDNYRYMEALGPETLDWMKAQGSFTRSMFDSIQPRADLGKRVGAFTGSFGFINGYATYGTRAFYEERTPGSDNFDLMVRDASGVRKLVDIAALRAAHDGKPYAINYFLASPDGAKVAVGISQGGSEAAEISVYDAATGKVIAGPIDRADFGATAWSADSKTLFFIRLKQLAPGEDEIAKYKNATADAWDLKSDPVAVAGAGIGKGTSFAPDETPVIALTPGSDTGLLLSFNGVQNELKAWAAPAAQAGTVAAPWKLLFGRDDGVTSVDVHGDDIYLLSHKDAPTFKVLVLKAGEPLAAAKVLVAADPSRVIESIHAAADGLYVMTRKGAYSELLRVPAGTTKIESIALPVSGHIAEMFTDPRAAGVSLQMSSWVVAPTLYRYDPKTGHFEDLNLGVKGAIAAAAFTVSDLKAKAKDGVEVPLSLIQPKGNTGPHITLVEAYGSYGISELADFSSRRAAALKEGVNYGICHVRGGGELGEAWRLGGKDANKHNTWQDIIACGEDLIARGITTKDKLFIIGGSAGGITMGRALTERPDLFAGVLDLVPAANPLRSEFSPNGPPNIPEFGTVSTEAGFKNLYAMDSIQHVKPGVTYPAVMIATGLNDPRVSPWEPAKFAAALIAAGSPNPVLLRIDEQAGHGVGSTKTQTDALTADGIAFMFWRAGQPGWQPAKK